MWSRQSRRTLPRKRSLQDSQLALGRQDVKFFSQRLPSAEQWRVYRDFASKAAFVDIGHVCTSPGHGATSGQAPPSRAPSRG
jgi:hypothetical protein